jgi:hypothetical protein
VHSSSATTSGGYRTSSPPGIKPGEEGAHGHEADEEEQG